jgi:hypothetical protein
MKKPPDRSRKHLLRFYCGRFLAFAIASTVMLFAGEAAAAEQIKISGPAG